MSLMTNIDNNIDNTIDKKTTTGLRINEIYFSLQGESTYVGRPCIFIRLTGCELRCNYCDSEYTFYEGKMASLTQILTKIAKFPCRLVEITGGEPMLQANTPALAKTLLEKGYEVLIETSGSQNLATLDPQVVKVCDVKTPSSGEGSSFLASNLNCLSKKDQIKFVIRNWEDFEFSTNWIQQHKPASEVLFSPVYEELKPEELAKWILDEGIDVRMQLQMHKIIWPDRQRGV